jgi:thymidylate synthase (FAD)
MTYDLCANPPHHNFVANGFVTHNSINEMSGRYVELKPEFYLPDDDHVRVQVGKPGHYTYIPAGGELADPAIAGPSWAWNELGPSGAGPVTKGMLTRLQLERAFYHAFTAYQSLLSDGVAKEIARACLPVATYSEMYWACNLRALLNFLSLRNHPKALQEIRDYATVMEAELARHMPVTHAAFVANDKVAP